MLGIGLLLGMQHATEADHLAAVAALASRGRSLRSGIYHGVAWGVGHTFTLLAVTAGIGLVGVAMSPTLSAHLEKGVGLMLIGLGVGVLGQLRRERIAGDAHAQDAHAQRMQLPTPVGPSDPPSGSPHDAAHGLPWRSLVVGTVHGLAGSAALVLLASAAMPTPAWMLVYAGVFGAGSIFGMAILSGALAVPLGLTARRLTRVHRLLNACVGLFSMGLGTRMLFALGGA